MFCSKSAKSNDELISQLKERREIKSGKIEKVMRLVDRGDFAKDDLYEDCPQYIGYGATISAPNIHAFALEHLEDLLKEGNKVLDVGSGSGYLSTCFAYLVGKSGQVIGIDHIKELVDWSYSNIRKNHSDLLKSKRIQFIVGDGREGYAENGPYQAIHVGAAAKKTPQKLLDQLAPGGKLLIPVYSLSNPGTQTLEQIEKTEDGQIFRTKLMGVRFVPLTDKEVQWNED